MKQTLFSTAQTDNLQITSLSAALKALTTELNPPPHNPNTSTQPTRIHQEVSSKLAGRGEAEASPPQVSEDQEPRLRASLPGDRRGGGQEVPLLRAVLEPSGGGAQLHRHGRPRHGEAALQVVQTGEEGAV